MSYSISVLPSNKQVKKFMGPSSIGGFPLKGLDGVVSFQYFKDEYGEESDLTIPDGGELILDPERPIDKYNIDVFELWRKEYPAIASQFLVADLTIEREKKRNMRKHKSKALVLVTELANDDFDTSLALARRLGMRKFDVERADVIEFLEEMADTDPDTLISALEDPEKEMRLLIEKAISRAILSRTTEGQIKYGPEEGGQPIGKNEDEAIIYLKHQPELLAQVMAEVENKPLYVREKRGAGPVVSAENANIENPEALLVEVEAWIASGLLKSVMDDKGKLKEISYSSMTMGKTPQKVVDYLLANKHFINIIRQRAAK